MRGDPCQEPVKDSTSQWISREGGEGRQGSLSFASFARNLPVPDPGSRPKLEVEASHALVSRFPTGLRCGSERRRLETGASPRGTLLEPWRLSESLPPLAGYFGPRISAFLRTSESGLGRLGVGLWLLLLVVALPPEPATAAETDALPFAGVLEFLDGSILHGRLQSASRERGLEWEHPATERPILFRPANVASMTFEGSRPITPSFKPMCRFRFANGDEIYGNLSSLSTTEVELTTWFGGNLRAPRESIRTISFFWNGYDVIYEGPTGSDGWVFSHDNGRGWRYRDGAFVTSEPGVVGRNFKLPPSAAIEFDLEWTQPFSLAFTTYTQTIDRFDFSASSYVFYLNRGGITLQRMQMGVGVSSIGRAELPSMLAKNRLHLDLRFDMETAGIILLADGKIAGQWKDGAGFAARGGGIVFSSQMSGPTVSIRNLRVAEWDGRVQPPESTNAPPQGDFVVLGNRDQLVGKLESIRNQKMRFTAPQADLEIPIARVREISLINTNPPASAGGVWEVRAFVMGGGAVAFHLDAWEKNRIAGTSTLLGKIELDPQSIRRLQFNLGQWKTSTGTGSPPDEFDAFDE